MKKIVVLTSGMSRGSNFESIANYLSENNKNIEVSWVLITRKKAPIQERCNKRNIPFKHISTKDYNLFEEKLETEILATKPDLIVLAGFMRKLSQKFIKNVHTPIFNIHPALLPNFGGHKMFGSKVHEAVFATNEKISGATVHFVDEEYDHGKIFMQESTSIENCNSPEEIGKAVLKVEHSLYARAICAFLEEEK